MAPKEQPKDSIGLLMHYLQADLRVCLENPSGKAILSLVNTINGITKDREAMNDTEAVTKDREPTENSLWWMSHMKASLRLFAQYPTKEGYLSLVRMSNDYLELVSDGLIIPVRVSRITSFQPESDYWFRLLGDLMSSVIDRPTELNVRGLIEQLGEYCKQKGVSL